MKRILISALLLTCVLNGGATIQAQTGDDPILSAMQAISSLEGRWEGAGWSRRGPAEPEYFTSLEQVESRLDGRALLIEGLHHDTGDAAKVVHHALAMTTYDPDAGRYDFRSYAAGHGSGNFEGHVEGGTFIWGFEIPGRGQIRYTIRIEDDEWHEVGEFSADGSQWNQVFQMDLRKVGE